MPQESLFRGVLSFFQDIGLYDVVLPFILVFTIVFAIFEKTRVFGTVDIEGKQYPKKNLNAMASFVIAFLVIASSELVGIITKVSSQMVILLFLSVLFLLLIGSFMKEGPIFLEGGWKLLFVVIMFIGIIVIFLGAIKFDGKTWLDMIWGWLSGTNTSQAVGSIILVVVLIVFILYIIKDPDAKKSVSDKT